MNKYLGQKLNTRYEVLEQIGTGGMSNVYKAYDLLEEKIVAVKILKDELANDDEFVERFKNESKAIAVLSHPNIVKVYDVNFSKEHKYIVMEYVDGITLKDYINQEGIINWKEAIHFTIETLKALQHAHDKGIVHRDIKPHNIMILSNGKIKVMDFGIARFARNDTSSVQEKTVGSVHYVSPEQAQGHFTDQKTDIYSLGVVMYEMLSGELPFDGESAVDVALKQISNEPRRLRVVNPQVPEGLEDIVGKAMQKTPFKRYHTASEMLFDLNIFKENPEISFDYIDYANNEENPYYINLKKQSEKIIEERKQVSVVARRQDRFEKNEDPISTAMPITFGIVLGFIISAIVGLVYFLVIKQPFARVPDITTPDLLGKTIEEVEQLSRKDSSLKEITIKIIDRQISDEFTEGLIMKQDPKAGRKIKSNSTIEVIISTGIKDLSMPNLRNQKQIDAIRTLKQMGIDPKVETKSDPSIPSGNVIGTNVEPGTKLTEDMKIILYISSGEGDDLVKVPNLVGLANKDLAREVLESFNLKLGEITEVESKLPPGSVVSQVELAGSEIETGTEVSIAVSAGGGLSQLAITINLPYISREVTIQIFLNDEEVKKETFVPSMYDDYKVLLDVSKGDLVDVVIDNKALALYEIKENTLGELYQDTIFDNVSSLNELA